MPGRDRGGDHITPADDTETPEVVADFDRVVDEMYVAPPDDFVAVRDEHAKQARAAGEPDLAKALRALRRPSRPAWLVNLLRHEDPDTVDRLLDLGAALREAQGRADGAKLRELSDARRRLIDALLGQARTLAADSGLDSVPADVQRAVQQTLEAALADEGVAEQVRTGRLVKPAEYTGFGVGAMAEVAVITHPASRRSAGSDGGGAAKPATKPATRPATRPGPKSAAKPAPKESAPKSRSAPRSTARQSPARPVDDTERARRAEAALERERTARRERAREAAENAVSEARERLERAEADLDANEHAVQDAVRHRDDLAAEVQQLRERLRELERQLRAADSDVRATTNRRNRSETSYNRAEERLREAEDELDQLS